MKVSLIGAMAENRVVGRENQMPWHLPEDLKRFRKITTGHPIIMGRKTFESIGRPLPNRENVVITRQKDYAPAGVTVVSSLDEAISRCEGKTEEVFVIGGGEIWSLALDRADRIYLTLIHKRIDGDAYFPEFDGNRFKVVEQERHEGEMPYSFITFDIKEIAR